MTWNESYLTLVIQRDVICPRVSQGLALAFRLSKNACWIMQQ